jgi:Ferritin-like
VARDLAWIKQQLQIAVELECATLPLYLAAMYSLEVQSKSAYTALRSVAMEEMVHMAIAANTLAALGGSPKIANIKMEYPVRGLPGGVEPDIHIGLAQMSKPQLEKFMRIEMPDFLVKQTPLAEAYPTIGAFYQGIRQAILDNAEAVRAAVAKGGPANQVNDNIGFQAIAKVGSQDVVSEIISGIDRIMEQGEGASCGSMFTGADSEDEASHYNRFCEIYYGARYQDPAPPRAFTRAAERDFYRGRAVPFPAVVNTLAVPPDGYAKILALDPNAAAAETDLKVFDTCYSSILSALDAVWNGPQAASWKTLGGSVHSMVDLRVLSCFNIIRHQIPSDPVGRLKDMYPEDFERMRTHSRLDEPLFYGPRFLNVNGA